MPTSDPSLKAQGGPKSPRAAELLTCGRHALVSKQQQRKSPPPKRRHGKMLPNTVLSWFLLCTLQRRTCHCKCIHFFLSQLASLPLDIVVIGYLHHHYQEQLGSRTTPYWVALSCFVLKGSQGRVGVEGPVTPSGAWSIPANHTWRMIHDLSSIKMHEAHKRIRNKNIVCICVNRNPGHRTIYALSVRGSWKAALGWW